MNEIKNAFFKRSWTYTFLRVGLALGIAFFISQINLDYMESFFYDLRVRLRAQPSYSNQIVLLTIDNKTQEYLKRMPEAKDHTALFNQLSEHKPEQIAYVQSFGDIMGSYEELEQLAESVKNLPLIVIDSSRLPEVGVEDDFRLLPPLQDVNVMSGPITSDNMNFARDGVTRRAIVSFNNTLLAHAEMAKSKNNIQVDSQYRGLFELKRTNQVYIQFRPADTYPKISFIDVMLGQFKPEYFKDKIVIIGRETKSDTKDYVMTPYSRDVLAMSKLELHANMLDTLIQNKAPIKWPDWLSLMITSLISILTVFVVLTLRPAKGLMILGVFILLFTIVAWTFFASASIWVTIAHPLLAIFICYYFFIPYRLIIENRKSWEYYQRNTLLTQVEELKSNFLRMMSHDLKTPLARIQGMTEVALREPDNLTTQQLDALKLIGRSSEELTEFIGSVLSLSRTESKEIKLQLKSKDVNALINEVIGKVHYLAKQKNIEIVTELEPLFSLKIDEDLMRQVFTNLIENAIKYSPENTKILVTTEEFDGRIQVQVADQGFGIPKEDMQNLFSKFYRAKNVSEDIKGSGLGLYLSRYFVNLHRGDITVESEPQRGSTFTVELPMNL
jgi:signal transduction histidine kinase